MHEIERLYKSSYSTRASSALRWPPDVFAICAYFAKISGCYRAYSHSASTLKTSVKTAVEDGKAWRGLLDRTPEPKLKDFPERVANAWSYLGRNIQKSIDTLSSDNKFVKNCLYLIVACDQACVGVGLPGAGGGYFELISEIRLGSGTLCRSVPVDSLRVLPKQHTPQSGFNIRSLTHHLALCAASEVCPVWTQIPSLHPSITSRSSYNVLLAPWPLKMEASDISASSRTSSHSGKFGYFDYAPSTADAVDPVVKWLRKVFQSAKRMGQHVDLVVFPECSLTIKQWNAISKVATKQGASVVAGVRVPGKSGLAGENSLRFGVPFGWQVTDVQYKHHRWQIEENQISNYGLGGTLDRKLSWWENINVQDRKLNFFAMSSDLVICPLICEDLARQDPVAELVRSIGPNLVIALLMDGPQIAERWSARYASVLADDPGSSVLTISSLGMVKLSRPRGCGPSRTFASWKDAFGNFVPLELSANGQAMILNLQFRCEEEHSVDGRQDGGVASFPVLCGTHPVEF